MQKFETFLNDGLNIDPDDIELVDIHRLPQYPIKKNSKTVHRPIIVKLTSTQDKNPIFSSAQNLKTYDETRRSYDEHSPYVYVTEHLPANRVYTVRENQGKTYLFGDGQGKSGRVREFNEKVREKLEKVREIFLESSYLL